MCAIAGFSLMFVGLLSILENSMAQALGVPATRFPGAMTNKLLEDGEDLRQVVDAMVGAPELLDHVLQYPVLAIFFLFMASRVTPFLAAMTSSECISVDMGNRAVRFEVVRTGRLEWVVGRFVGQAFLSFVAVLLATFGVWLIGMLLMVGNQPLWLAWGLLGMSLRVWVFCLPFVGFGVACSQMTTSSAWARVLSIGGVAIGWILWRVGAYYAAEWDSILLEVVLQAFPWAWMGGLWEPGLGGIGTVVVCLAMATTAVGLGFLRFARRDL